MELWIRSQDKLKLVKVNYVYAIENKINSFSIYGETIDSAPIIGRYETKERAIEVLDEIQNILKPTIITTGYECELKENIKDKTSFYLDMIPTKTEIQELSTVVYEMPEK